MERSKLKTSPLVAGFLSVSMAMHSPAGHDFVHEGLLRVWFAKEWITASQAHGHIIGFEEFREQAEIWLDKSNTDAFIRNVRLLNERASFCIPVNLNDEDENQPSSPTTMAACHAATGRESRKNKLAPL